MNSKTFTIVTALFVIALVVSISKIVSAQPAPRSPQLEEEIISTVNAINNAFMRGDLRELDSYMHPEVTMLHGHHRLNDLREVEAEWTNLFAARAKAPMAYTLKTSDLKTQIYDNVIVVTFSYEHPRLSGSRVSTESGKAVYVLLRQPEAVEARSPSLATKRSIVMVHCAVIADRDQQSPLP